MEHVQIQNYLTPPKKNYSLRTDDIDGASPNSGKSKFSLFCKQQSPNQICTEPAGQIQTPQKEVFCSEDNPKYCRRRDKTEISKLGIFDYPNPKIQDPKLNFRMIGFQRNLNTFDITGATTNTMKSQALKNREKIYFYRSLQNQFEPDNKITNDYQYKNIYKEILNNQINLPQTVNNLNQTNNYHQNELAVKKFSFKSISPTILNSCSPKLIDNENPQFLRNRFRFYNWQDDQKMEQIGKFVLQNNTNNFYKGYTPNAQSRQQYDGLTKIIDQQKHNYHLQNQQKYDAAQKMLTDCSDNIKYNQNQDFYRNKIQFYDPSIQFPKLRSLTQAEEKINKPKDNIQLESQEKEIMASLIDYQRKYNAQSIANMQQSTFNIINYEQLPQWRRIINPKFLQNQSMIELDDNNYQRATDLQAYKTLPQNQLCERIRTNQNLKDIIKSQIGNQGYLDSIQMYNNNQQQQQQQLYLQHLQQQRVPKYMQNQGIPQWNYKKNQCVF